MFLPSLLVASYFSLCFSISYSACEVGVSGAEMGQDEWWRSIGGSGDGGVSPLHSGEDVENVFISSINYIHVQGSKASKSDIIQTPSVEGGWGNQYRNKDYNYYYYKS